MSEESGPEIALPEQNSETQSERSRIHAETTQRIEAAQEARAVRQDGDTTGWGMDTFNNLFLHLPTRKDSDVQDSRRDWEQKRGRWNTPYGEHPTTDVAGYSDKYLAVTPAEFYEEVDASLDKNGITRDEVEELLSKGKDALYTRIVPVYEDLRIQGYSHTDLSV